MSKLGKFAVAVAMACSVGAAFGHTSALYVQDGLVHQWDGIENAGVGLSDTSARVWVDLKGEADLTLKDEKSQFTGTALTRSALNYAYAKADAAITGVKTVEVTFRREAYQTYAVILSLEGYKDNGRGLLTMKNDGIGSTYHGYHDSYDATHCKFVTVALYADVAKGADNLFVDGVALPPNTASEGWSSGMANEFTLGGRWNSSSANCFSGEIFACRLYDRHLTPEELVKNAKVDAIRFNGAGGGETLTVTGSPEDYGEVSPAYGTTTGLTAGEDFPCVASKVWTNETETVAATCVGYKILVDGVVSDEKTFGEADEATFTYVHPDCIVGAELVWGWTTKCRVQAETSGGGTVEMSGDGWFASGETATVTAVPTEDAAFHHWEGDVDEADRFSPTIRLTIGATPATLKAIFSNNVYVSRDGSDANGGTSWGDAFATVEKALASGDAPVVHVGEGVYDVTTAIKVTNAAVVRGSGARGAVFRLAERPEASGDDKRAVFFVANELARLENIALTTGGGSNGRGLSLMDGTVENCAITNCSTPNLTMSGGGIYMEKGLVRNCLIDSNICQSSGGGSWPGGGIYMKGGLVENCTITRNQATYGTGSSCGGVYMKDGTVRNCLVAKNQAVASGYGLKADGGTVENCTIADNFYEKASSGYGVVAAAGVTFRNNIVWGNTNPSGLANASVSATTCSHNDCEPALAGADNIAVNPNFNDDYTLGFSGCVNSGLLLDWMEGATDLAGNPRVVGDRPDMGCFERSAGSGIECSFTATGDGAADSSRVTLEAQTVGDTEGIVYYWKVWGKDGNLVEDISGADCGTTVVTLGADSYTVSLAVTNGAGKGAAPAPVEDAVKVYATRVYVSEKGSNVRPYATLESGAHDFETAFGLLAPGGTAYVDDGVYEIASCVLLGGAFGTKVVSLNGPANCVIKAAADSRFDSLKLRMFEMTAADARLEGLTLAGGRRGFLNPTAGATTYGTVSMKSAGAVVTNCVIRDVTGAPRGPSGAGVNMEAGTIVDTVFDNICEEMSSGTAVSGVALTMSGGTAERLTITNCQSVGTSILESLGCVVRLSGCVIRNSLVAGCTGSHAEPVYLGSGATMENCSIVHNANTETEATRKPAEGPVPNRHCGGLTVAAGATVVNTIVADNTSTFCGNAESNLYMTAEANLTACLVPDRETLPGEGHVFSRPKYRRGGHRLRNSSPGVDQGVVRDWMDGAKDVEGRPRVQGVAPDIGCYEDFVHGLMLIAR